MNKYYSMLLKRLSRSCKYWRIRKGYTIKEIAKDTGYKASNIYHFEQGINDNAIIFCWYIDKGFDIDKDMIIGTEIKNGIVYPRLSSFDNVCIQISEGIANGKL